MRVFRWKPTLLEILVLISILAVLISLLLPGIDQDSSHRYPEPIPGDTNEFAAIAGEYYQGAHLGRHWRLSLLPDGRYSFVWSGCCGVYHRESGWASKVSGQIRLSPVKPIEPPMDRAFLAFRWGLRSYLVPTTKMNVFCDAIIQGVEPRNELPGNFYAHGLGVRVTGVPKLPEPWVTYLREHLVIGTITELSKDGRAKIDVGSADGIHADSILRPQGGDDGMSRRLVVESVDANSAVVSDFHPEDFTKPVKVGANVVTTREAGE